MDFKFKFEIGEKVKLKNSNKTGEVRGRRYEEYMFKVSSSSAQRYYVNLGGFYNDWQDADKLESLEHYDDTFEIGLINELIDGNLSTGNFKEVKRLSEQRKKYTN